MKTKKPNWYRAAAERNVQDLSLDDIRSMIWDAIHTRFAGDDESIYVEEVYPSYLIYSRGKKFYRIDYSVLEGDVRLGEEETEVERTWLETRSVQDESDEQFSSHSELGRASDPDGMKWDVTICVPGFTRHGWHLSEEVLRNAAGLFEDVDVNLYEMPRGASHVPGELFDVKSLLVRNKVGWIDTVRFAAGEGLKGVLHFLESARDLGRNLVAGKAEGRQVYGLSYDCPVRAKQDNIEGKSVFRILKFLGADSVDIVTRPAAGGKFNRAIAARSEEGDIMDKQALFNLIKEKRPELVEGKAVADLTDDEVTTLARMAMEPTAPADGTGGDGHDGDGDTPATRNDLALMRCRMDLDAVLSKCELPETAVARIRGTFADRVFTAEELTRAIADEKDYLAALTQATAGDGDGVPASRIAVAGLGSVQRAQLAVDRMFGLTSDDMRGFADMERLDGKPFFGDMRAVASDLEGYDQVPKFSGLREMYAFFTGDAEVTGHFNRRNLPADLRASADITSATFSYVLGNTLARRLVKDYRAANYQEDLLISIRKTVADFRQQEAVLIGYFGDLDTVDPESADYQEIAAVTDEESTYTIAQKGNLLTITRKTIINDDLSVINRLVGRLGRAARRTHAKYVWNFFINNSNCSDGTAWFTAPHGNLGSTALGFATALTAYKALAKMTEKDSGERIGLLDDPSVKPTLVGPVDILETLESIAQDEIYYASNDLTDKTRNPLRNKVAAAAVSLLTDTNDWGLLMPPSEVDMIEMGYLNGRQEPEMFVTDSPQSEQVFVADKIRHKIRHEYAGAVVDFVSGYKAVVA